MLRLIKNLTSRIGNEMWIVLFIAFVIISGAYGTSYCRNRNGTILYCRYGCCGYEYDKYCCSESTYNVAMIAGLSLLLLVMLAGGIAAYFWYKRRRQRAIERGVIMTTGTQPGVFYPSPAYGPAVFTPPPYTVGGYPPPCCQPGQPYPPQLYFQPGKPYPQPGPPYPEAGPPYPQPGQPV